MSLASWLPITFCSDRGIFHWVVDFDLNLTECWRCSVVITSQLEMKMFQFMLTLTLTTSGLKLLENIFTFRISFHYIFIKISANFHIHLYCIDVCYFFWLNEEGLSRSWGNNWLYNNWYLWKEVFAWIVEKCSKAEMNFLQFSCNCDRPRSSYCYNDAPFRRMQIIWRNCLL